jgi:16S rRNA (uracil1498-N3)-methyltransferase
MEFRDAIRACAERPGALTALAWEGLCGSAAHESLSAALRASVGAQPVVNLFIGPEGGFSDEEVELARTLGAVVFGLGPRILRAETAALAALAAVQYELGGL